MPIVFHCMLTSKMHSKTLSFQFFEIFFSSATKWSGIKENPLFLEKWIWEKLDKIEKLCILTFHEIILILFILLLIFYRYIKRQIPKLSDSIKLVKNASAFFCENFHISYLARPISCSSDTDPSPCSCQPPQFTERSFLRAIGSDQKYLN